MKIEKVIKQLESIADHTRSMAASPDADEIWKEDSDALEFAITALRSMQEVGEPLSLEQLRKMDGKPVWVEFIGHPDGTPIEPLWMLVNCREKRLVTDVEYVDWNFEGWFAYPYPPAHIDRSKREGCDCDKPKSCCTCCSTRCQYCIKQSEYRQAAYCMKCGKPLTEAAWAELEQRVMK